MKRIKSILASVIGMAVICSSVAGTAAVLSGCTQAERASYNISKQADNFNIVRRVTVID